MATVQDDRPPDLSTRIARLDLGNERKLACRLDSGPRGEPSEVGETVWLTVLASHADEVSRLREDQPGTLTWGRVDGPYQADVVVAAVDGDMNRVELALATDPKRVQRRQFFRVTGSLEVVVTSEHETATAMTVDLSESGLRLALREPLGGLSARQRVQLTLTLPDDREVLAEAEVVRIRVNAEGGAEMSVRFTRIGSADRDRIRAYLFERQRQMRRFGLL